MMLTGSYNFRVAGPEPARSRCSRKWPPLSPKWPKKESLYLDLPSRGSSKSFAAVGLFPTRPQWKISDSALWAKRWFKDNQAMVQVT